MLSNTFGRLFRATTFGESHGAAMGCVVDGCPAGLELSAADITKELNRRRPSAFYGSRDEKDIPEILSGIFEGKTLGSPIAIVVRNENQNSAGYDELKNIHRPQHADFCWEKKFGIRDHRGGGRSSGRETLCRVAAGAVAKKLLANNSSITIRAWVSSIADLQQPLPGEGGFDFDEIECNPLRIPCKAGAEKALEKIEQLRTLGDSAGGTISCLITGVPAGLGEPVFDKLDARLAAAILSIGACKGIEFGSGFAAANLTGSENNALAHSNPQNSHGGILGGISTGQDIFFSAAFKPTPTTGKAGHDICITPRAVPVVEAMAALALADFMLLARSSQVK